MHRNADNGLWRSLVAHYTGGVGVAGSNPVSPTNFPGHFPGLFLSGSFRSDTLGFILRSSSHAQILNGQILKGPNSCCIAPRLFGSFITR